VADVLLGIETSCDETSAAVLVGERRRPELAGLVILSQDVHRVFGGVVPELASRAHLAALPAVVDRALAEAGISWSAVDAVAVTQGPGLVGALLVGVVYAKALAYAGDRQLIGVHHMEGHLFAPLVEDPDLAPPFVALLVSGGHTLLLDVPAWGRYRLLGATRDDAAGEAFDSRPRCCEPCARATTWTATVPISPVHSRTRCSMSWSPSSSVRFAPRAIAPPCWAAAWRAAGRSPASPPGGSPTAGSPAWRSRARGSTPTTPP